MIIIVFLWIQIKIRIRRCYFFRRKWKRKIYSINSIQIPNVVTQGKTIEEAKKTIKRIHIESETV